MHPEPKGIVVFIHGFMGSPKQFSGLIAVAYDQGFSIAALLLPGHGGTAKDFASGTCECWQNHVNSELERFSREYSKIILVGHSMGGLLAINAAVKHNEYMCGLFLLTCPFLLTPFSLPTIKFRLNQVLNPKYRPVVRAYKDSSSVKMTPNIIWCSIKPSAEVKKLIHITEQILPEVKVPISAVYSFTDELTSIKSLDILKSGLLDVQFEQVLLSDSFHAYYTPKDQNVVEQSFMDFVNKTATIEGKEL